MAESAILGQSQTFFGVLTTLVILCTIFTDSNFLNKIIEKIRDEMKAYSKKSCDEYRESLERNNAEVEENIKLRIDAFTLRSERDNSERDNIAAANAVLDNIRLVEVSLENSITELEKNRDRLFSKSEMDEQISTPLYAFLFCLVVFLCDELTLSLRVFQDWVTTLLYIFTSLSFALCTSLWYFYYLRTSAEEFFKPKEEYTMREAANKNIGTMLLYSILFFGIFLGIYTIASFYIKLTEVFYGAALSLFCFWGVLSISYVSIKELTTKYNDYTKMFIFRHFIYLLAVSVIFSLVLTLVSIFNIVPIYFDAFSNSGILKFMLIFFVLVNGIGFPFVLPIIRYSRYKKYIKNEIAQMKTAFSQKEKEVNEKLKEMEKDSNHNSNNNHNLS
jgi:hypothetical protein